MMVPGIRNVVAESLRAVVAFAARWHRETSAATSIEYALVISLVLLGAFIGLQQLSDSVQATFAAVGDSIDPGPAPREADAFDPAPKAVEEVADSTWHARRLLGLGQLAVLVICSALIAKLLYRTRKEAEQRKADGETLKQPEEIPNEVVLQKRHQILTALFDNIESLSEGQIRVGQVMTRKIHSVPPDAAVSELKQIVREQKKRHLLVCDLQGRLLGVISDRDILGHSGETAADIMTSDPITVERDSMLDPAVTLLIRMRISCLPVVHQGNLCGLLTTTDVMMALQCISQAMQRLNEQELAAGKCDAAELDALEQRIESELAADA